MNLNNVILDFSPATVRRLVLAAYRAWLLIGALLVIVWPDARGSDVWFGWLPLWLIVLPACSLAIVQPRSIGAHVVQLMRSRSKRNVPQARRTRLAFGA